MAQETIGHPEYPAPRNEGRAGPSKSHVQARSPIPKKQPIVYQFIKLANITAYPVNKKYTLKNESGMLS